MEANKIIEFLEELGKLKLLPRTGWLMRGVRSPESVADHSFRVIAISMVLADALKERGMTVDVERVMRLAIMHDWAETLTTDLPHVTHSLFSKGAVERAEARAFDHLILPLGAIGQHYKTLWQEYEARTSLEARIVKAADLIELMLQACEYEKQGIRNLEDFWERELNLNELVDDELLGALAEHLRRSHTDITEQSKF